MAVPGFLFFWSILTCPWLPRSSWELAEEGNYIEGDIKLDPGEDGQNRNAVLHPEQRWPDGVVYYDFGDDFLPWHRPTVEDALRDLEQETCVVFKRRTNESDYVVVRNFFGHQGDKCQFLAESECWAPVGYHKGKREMSLDCGGCLKQGIIQHEFLHVLGFWHEHTRSDRDAHVSIWWLNIKFGREHNFYLRPTSESQLLGLPYDYGSVMHYGRYAFAKIGFLPTIVPYKFFEPIGQRERVSNLDIAKLNRLYECADKYQGEDLQNTKAPYPVSSMEELLAPPSYVPESFEVIDGSYGFLLKNGNFPYNGLLSSNNHTFVNNGVPDVSKLGNGTQDNRVGGSYFSDVYNLQGNLSGMYFPNRSKLTNNSLFNNGLQDVVGSYPVSNNTLYKDRNVIDPPIMDNNGQTWNNAHNNSANYYHAELQLLSDNRTSNQKPKNNLTSSVKNKLHNYADKHIPSKIRHDFPLPIAVAMLMPGHVMPIAYANPLQQYLSHVHSTATAQNTGITKEGCSKQLCKDAVLFP